MVRPGDGRRAGFSLLEVLVGLIVLEVGLLGAVGLVVLAAERLARATLVERAAGEAAAVADSLSWYRGGRSGRAVRGEWEVTWGEDAGMLLLRATPLGATETAPVAEIRLP